MLNLVTSNLYRLDDSHPWSGRRRQVVDLLMVGTPDVVFATETPEDREAYLLANLSPVGLWKTGSDQANCVILFRSDKFTLVDSRKFTLKGGDRSRYGSGAILLDKATNRKICCVVVHPASSKDENPEVWRVKQIIELWAKLTEWGVTEGDMPLIIGGDFNDALRSSVPGVAQTMVTYGMVDALDQIPDSLFINREYNTATGWKPPKKNGLHIDRFFVNAGMLRFISGQVILTKTYADHNFVRVSVDYIDSPTLPIVTPVATVGKEIAALLKKRGQVSEVSVAKVNAAIKGKYLSRYIYALQVWLQRPNLTGRWSAADQKAYDKFRKDRGIPGGLAGEWSLKALAQRAETIDLSTYPVVK